MALAGRLVAIRVMGKATFAHLQDFSGRIQLLAKVDKLGNWLKSWGEPGSKPGQFNTPHSIAIDAQGNVYVADRGNHRIQVFDGDGKFLRQFTIDVPVPPGAKPAIGKIPDEAMMAGGTAMTIHPA